MNKIIEIAKALHTSREDADHRLTYLKEKAERDLIAYNSELKDLDRIIDHEYKLQQFMKTKEVDLSEMHDTAVQSR